MGLSSAPIPDVPRAPGRSGEGIGSGFASVSRFLALCLQSGTGGIAADLVGPGR